MVEVNIFIGKHANTTRKFAYRKNATKYAEKIAQEASPNNWEWVNNNQIGYLGSLPGQRVILFVTS